MLVLQTGGAGYIGSHTARALQSSGFEPVVLDNLTYGHQYIIEDVQNTLIEGDIRDRKLTDQIMSGNHEATAFRKVDAVMHFAAFAYVGESVNEPAKYYRNNVANTLNLLEVIKDESSKRGVQIPLIFSSTCAAYGSPPEDQIPIKETCPLNPINPYGRSKVMVEQLIADFGNAYQLPSVILDISMQPGQIPILP